MAVEHVYFVVRYFRATFGTKLMLIVDTCNSRPGVWDKQDIVPSVFVNEV